MELFILIGLLAIGTRYAVRYHFHAQKKLSVPSVINPLGLDKEIFLHGIDSLLVHNGDIKKIIVALEKSMVGASGYINTLLAAYIAGGHVIIQGPPGTGKTLLVKTFAQLCDLSYRRIQCTPDLLPQDVIGSEILQKDTHELVFNPGPLFANVVHVDEINRTTPKLQSAFLEGMQEGQVTAFGKSYILPQPFFLVATQNPYDALGTYLLPYAQIDRFMVGITTNNLDVEAEIELIKQKPILGDNNEKIISHNSIANMIQDVAKIYIAEDMLQYAVQCLQFAKQQGIQLSVRASKSLVTFAKAIAYMQGNSEVKKNDIQLSLLPILKHRIDYVMGFYVNEEKIFNLMTGAQKKDDIVAG